MTRIWRLVLLILVVTVVAATMATRAVESALQQTLRTPEAGAILVVEPGDSFRAVLARANRQGWLSDTRWLALWARWQGLDRSVHVGEYAVDATMTARQLLLQLQTSAVVQYQVTIPEGLTLSQAIARLHEHPALTNTLTGAQDSRLLQLVAPQVSAEGWFLPETYAFTRGDTDFDILLRAYSLQSKLLTSLWSRRSDTVEIKTPYEALILASLIERETSVADERPLIAGVFNRRLRNGMRLQTDPSVIYGLGAGYDGNLTRQHLRDADNHWNTYRIPALPPTPIALPGRDALEAALHPAPGTSLYFVARGDGYHAFADTLEEHNANVRRYQYKRGPTYRSTPDQSSDTEGP